MRKRPTFKTVLRASSLLLMIIGTRAFGANFRLDSQVQQSHLKVENTQLLSLGKRTQLVAQLLEPSTVRFVSVNEPRGVLVLDKNRILFARLKKGIYQKGRVISLTRERIHDAQKIGSYLLVKHGGFTTWYKWTDFHLETLGRFDSANLYFSRDADTLFQINTHEIPFKLSVKTSFDQKISVPMPSPFDIGDLNSLKLLPIQGGDNPSTLLAGRSSKGEYVVVYWSQKIGFRPVTLNEKLQTAMNKLVSAEPSRHEPNGFALIYTAKGPFQRRQTVIQKMGPDATDDSALLAKPSQLSLPNFGEQATSVHE